MNEGAVAHLGEVALGAVEDKAVNKLAGVGLELECDEVGAEGLIYGFKMGAEQDALLRREREAI